MIEWILNACFLESSADNAIFLAVKFMSRNSPHHRSVVGLFSGFESGRARSFTLVQHSRATLLFQLSTRNKRERRDEALWPGRVGDHPVSLRFRLSSDVSTATWISCVATVGAVTAAATTTVVVVVVVILVVIVAVLVEPQSICRSRRGSWGRGREHGGPVIVTSFWANFGPGRYDETR